MTVWPSLRARAQTWIEDVATGLTLLGAMLRRTHRVELAEQADGSFSCRGHEQATSGTR